MICSRGRPDLVKDFYFFGFPEIRIFRFGDVEMLLKFYYLNHFLKITCCRKGSRRHEAPLKSRSLSPIHLSLHNSLILLNTIRSGIRSFAAHLPFLLCVPTFAFPEPQSACGACGDVEERGCPLCVTEQTCDLNSET